MPFDARKAFLAVLALAALCLFFWPLQLMVYAFVKTFYEGNSVGKTLGFLGWLLLYFGVLSLKHFNRLPRFLTGARPLRWFLYAAALASLTGFFLHFLLLYQFLPVFSPQNFSSIIGTMSRGPYGAIEWEASYLGHTHEGKTALALAANFLLPGLKADTGLPLYGILPFAPLFSLFLLGLLLLAAWFALQEGVASYTGPPYPGRHSIRPLLWGFISYGVMVLMLDGNLFTAGSQLVLGLLLYYLLRTRTAFLQRPWQHVAYPLFGLGGLLFAASYAFGLTIAATYTVSVLLFCLLGLTVWSYKRALPHKALWLLLLLFFGYYSFDAFVGTGFGRVLQPGTHAEFFAYGVDSRATNEQFAHFLEPQLDGVSVERHGWLAFFSGTTKTLTSPKLIERALGEALHPSGYFDVVYLPGYTYDVQLSSAQDLSGLADVKSAFESFSVDENGKVHASGKLDALYANLFALNFLRGQGPASAGQPQPVVISR